MSKPARLAVPTGRAIEVRFALTLVVVLVASLVAGSGATGATQAPTFVRADYPFLGNNHIVGDFNGDGSLDLAGPRPFAAVRLNH
jgi:hypothetical protein